ncbi:transketolase family protein [Pseudonocardia spinosispora]|uniref:transketolase family protein n=1 Tax=Pseudonocardia spinosispora TaxID=103441 RepID=UPI0003F7300F|nr:transketolase [Pseudonocardia spinosispora]
MSTAVARDYGVQSLGMRDTFVATATELIDTDPRVAVVLAVITLDRFADAARRHPDRVIDVGIREQLLVTTAGGLALAGMRPIAHTFASFLVERPFEQIKLDLGHQDLGAVLVSSGASYDYPFAGRTHMSPGDVALIDTLPGWTIQVPGHPDEVGPLLRAAAAGDDRVYLRLREEPNGVAYSRAGEMTRLREGRRGVVLAVGPIADRVLAATEGLDVTVLYTPTVRPLDTAMLRAALPDDRADVMVVEPYLAGTSSHVISDALRDRPHRLAALGVSRDREVRGYGSVTDHDRAHGLDPASLARAARSFF